MTAAAWTRKDLLGIAELDRSEIQLILDTAASFQEIAQRPIKKVPTLRGKTVINLFFENSTRTRSSFEIAEKRLSADSLNFSSSGSALSKGESLLDTAMNLQAMQPDLLVIRHSDPGIPHMLAARLPSGVINAGDGAHEHPTQGLLDIMTMRQRLGNLEGKKVTIVGDISHSRVARSNIYGLTKLGAKVTVCGPPTMVPGAMAKLGADVELDLLKAVADADVINVLRIQLERQSQMVFPGNREYHLMYGVTADVMRRTKDSCFVMHPGPM
ncbi:MAG: aspartate carbamoyltransferase catalytic subunit, partial [Acidobacteria bacterium]|nr:aspartate carbamoyltransferase catalytic subunit [Acidobacteriota bacterium]